ncbi:hypothetical protein K466DRAFT_86265 [Polyporus arcularius HHB13444]|uniref:Uncharacterized protein n=1 Tax=Polyporus arcularius HHB13444 TaxID=1314778 RepID=A0A5C3PEE4_9APHY|nr:hypothetical protein K466DRAFT_86265 [Polyporus arcularius HHB13444]
MVIKSGKQLSIRSPVRIDRSQCSPPLPARGAIRRCPRNLWQTQSGVFSSHTDVSRSHVARIAPPTRWHARTLAEEHLCKQTLLLTCAGSAIAPILPRQHGRNLTVLACRLLHCQTSHLFITYRRYARASGVASFPIHSIATGVCGCPRQIPRGHHASAQGHKALQEG